MFQDLFIRGATGQLGKTLVSQIFDKGDTDIYKNTNPSRLTKLASSNRFVCNPNGIEESIAKEFAKYGKLGEFYDNDDALLTNTDELIVDLTNGGRNMLDFHIKARKLGYRVVMANKRPLVDCDYDTFVFLTNDFRFRYSCSVMAGAGAVDQVRQFRDLGDSITQFSGCFSGTLGYICSGLQEGKSLSGLVEEARDEGYTEKNPAVDLSGRDSGDKALILARTARYNVLPHNFRIEPFVSECYLQELDEDKILESLEKLNEGFRRRFDKALDKGNTLRYVADFRLNSDNEPYINVWLIEVPLDSDLGRLYDTFCGLTLGTETIGNNGLFLRTRGAGLKITAQNVRKDIARHLSERIMSA